MVDLRKRGRAGKTVPWTIEQLRAGFDQYHRTHGHYPTASEIDECDYLPTVRTMQRRLGGVVSVRVALGIPGDSDLRAGEHSSQRAYTINKRAHAEEHRVYAYLCEHFGKAFVHREYFFTDDRRTRADFFVHEPSGGFCVDVFYPKDFKNFMGCVNAKEKKYSNQTMQEHTMYLLYMNENIQKARIDQWFTRKKNKLARNVHIMSWPDFMQECGRYARYTMS